MCRICYIPDAAPLLKEDSPLKLDEFFAFLEKSAGKDGNGLGCFFENDDGTKKDPYIVKGVQQTTAGLAKLIRDVTTKPKEFTPPLNGWMFHTRLCSTGQKNDDNCHPFTGGRYILCHNGHWATHTDVKWPLIISGKLNIKDATGANDTRLMSVLVEHFGIETFNNISSFGVVLINGPPTKIPPNTSPESIKVPNEVIVIISDNLTTRDFEAVRIGTHWYYASEFPDGKYDEHVKFEGPIAVLLRDDGYTQLTSHGKIEKTEGKKKYTTTYSGVYNYGGCLTGYKNEGKGRNLPALTGGTDGVARKRRWWKWDKPGGDGKWRSKPQPLSVEADSKETKETKEKPEKEKDSKVIVSAGGPNPGD